MAKKLKQDISIEANLKKFRISIGANLKKFRQAAGMTQEEVAAKLQVQGLDIPQKIISEMELGKYNIRVSVLLALADLYYTPVQDFFEGLERDE